MATTLDHAATAPPASLAQRFVRLVRDAGALARDHVELAALDAHRAAMGLTRIIAAAVVASVLVVSAWLAFLGGAIVWATDNGANWPAALAIAALVNLALAGALLLWVKGLTREIGFAATLRQLRRTAEDARLEMP